jgi:hypothetical protein
MKMAINQPDPCEVLWRPKTVASSLWIEVESAEILELSGQFFHHRSRSSNLNALSFSQVSVSPLEQWTLHTDYTRNLLQRKGIYQNFIQLLEKEYSKAQVCNRKYNLDVNDREQLGRE